MHGIYISQPTDDGLIYIAERSRGSVKLLWSVMPRAPDGNVG
jgi:hypothetical protein